jgi:hypothetical protein
MLVHPQSTRNSASIIAYHLVSPRREETDCDGFKVVVGFGLGITDFGHDITDSGYRTPPTLYHMYMHTHTHPHMRHTPGPTHKCPPLLTPAPARMHAPRHAGSSVDMSLLSLGRLILVRKVNILA